LKELIQKENRALTAAEFQGLSDVPPEIEWFANIHNEKTRRAYQKVLSQITPEDKKCLKIAVFMQPVNKNVGRRSGVDLPVVSSGLCESYELFQYHPG